jgi:arsenate reductase
MAEAILQEIDHSLKVFSAGLHPDEQADPIAILVMKEMGIDISMKKPKTFREYEGMAVDYLITLCDGTKENMALVDISARHKIHLGFEDPRKLFCLENQVIRIYRELRDEIKNELDYFYSHVLVKELTKSNRI